MNSGNYARFSGKLNAESMIPEKNRAKIPKTKHPKT
jgi:hypothetical protein